MGFRVEGGGVRFFFGFRSPSRILGYLRCRGFRNSSLWGLRVWELGDPELLGHLI